MKLKKDIFLFFAKDNLISNKKFNIYWDSKKHIAWTDIINEKSLSKYYLSDSYDSFKEKPSKLIDYIYFYVQNLMLSYKWSITKQFILKDTPQPRKRYLWMEISSPRKNVRFLDKCT